MKLNIEKVAVRNFYSFGNRWQEFDFEAGVNLIIGLNKTTLKSNAAGKSNLFESIIFALFGRTTKDITKPQVINWKNKKQCELKIWFSKGEDKYIIHRGLKPTILKVFKNDVELDQLSNSKDFQDEIEENILEIDFNTFISLLHCNSSTSQSIFNVPKLNKRQFIEKLFGLETYTELTKKATDKINNLNSKISDIERTLKFNKKIIDDLHEQNEKFENEIENLSSVNNEIDELKTSLNFSSDEEQASVKLKEDLSVKKEKLEEKIIQKKIQIENIKNEIISIKTKIKSFNIEEIEEVDTSRISEIKKKLKQIEDIIVSFTETMDNLKISSEEIDDQIKTHEKSLSNYREELATIKGQMTSLIDPKKLSGKTECPTCSQEIDYKKIEEKINKDKQLLQEKTLKISEKMNIEKEKLEEKSNNFNNIKNKIKILEKAYQDQENLQKTLEALIYRQKMYDQSKKSIDELEKLKKSLEETIEQEKKFQEEIQKYNDLLHKTKHKINEIEKKLNNIKDLKEKLNELQIKEVFNSEQICKFREYVLSNGEKEEKIVEEEKEKIKEKEKYQTMLDYLEYIKKLCKDENVKQYAISNIVPFLNKQVNSYISEAGFPFYLRLNSWLDAEIKGPGIYDATFGNLSSGQQKTTNLAMMLAFQDVAKMQAKVFPDIILFDEILDSAIDSTTIEKMIKIINKKQKEDNTKVYVISHRKEINEISFDKIHRVEMFDGFSEIKTVQ